MKRLDRISWTFLQDFFGTLWNTQLHKKSYKCRILCPFFFFIWLSNYFANVAKIFQMIFKKIPKTCSPKFHLEFQSVPTTGALAAADDVKKIQSYGFGGTHQSYSIIFNHIVLNCLFVFFPQSFSGLPHACGPKVSQHHCLQGAWRPGSHLVCCSWCQLVWLHGAWRSQRVPHFCQPGKAGVGGCRIVLSGQKWLPQLLHSTKSHFFLKISFFFHSHFVTCNSEPKEKLVAHFCCYQNGWYPLKSFGPLFFSRPWSCPTLLSRCSSTKRCGQFFDETLQAFLWQMNPTCLHLTLAERVTMGLSSVMQEQYMSYCYRNDCLACVLPDSGPRSSKMIVMLISCSWFQEWLSCSCSCSYSSENC